MVFVSAQAPLLSYISRLSQCYAESCLDDLAWTSGPDGVEILVSSPLIIQLESGDAPRQQAHRYSVSSAIHQHSRSKRLHSQQFTPPSVHSRTISRSLVSVERRHSTLPAFPACLQSAFQYGLFEHSLKSSRIPSLNSCHLQ